jgi:hypothetical protein
VTPAAARALLVLGHLGELHPYETVLVLLLAFGPFVVIVLLVLRERRRHAAEDAAVEGGGLEDESRDDELAG